MELSLLGQIQRRADRVRALEAVTVLPPGLIHASSNPEVRGADMKVLVRLHESLSTSHFHPVRPWFYANLMNMDVKSVQRCLQRLEQMGYVERGEKCGNGNLSYRLVIPNGGSSPPPPVTSAA